MLAGTQCSHDDFHPVSYDMHEDTMSAVNELEVPLHLILAGSLLEPFQHQCGLAFPIPVACLYFCICCLHLQKASVSHATLAAIPQHGVT